MLKRVSIIAKYRCCKVRSKICPRCWGTGTFDSGETCYYCNGDGSVAD